MEKKTPFKYSSTFYRKKQKLLHEMQQKITGPNYSAEESSSSHSLPGSSPDTKDTKTSEPESECNQNNVAVQGAPIMSKDQVEAVQTEEYESYSQTMLNEFEDYEIAEPYKESLRSSLRDWALKFNIKDKALNDLLNILICNGHKTLPKDSRTFLNTPKVVNIQQMGSGHFWYHGIKNCLNHKLSKIDKSIELSLNFHADGLPINSSSKNQFWPILMNIVNFKEIPPQVVAIYCGTSKPPTAAEYLKEFVNELKCLIASGLTLNDHLIKIKVNAFICDTPARCFIKCVVPYNAYHGCMKCTVVGEYYRGGRHMSYPQIDCILRSDADFRSKADPDHHQKANINEEEVILQSPLEELPIDMIRDIPISDSLHLLDLGIMKRCLRGWVKGDFNFRTKFFVNQVESMSNWLVQMNLNMPSEIHRAVGGFDCLSFWKATEYRTFLLYLGPVILKNNLDAESYKHFLLLFCAVTILSTNYFIVQENFISIAENMLKEYIESFIVIYGVDAISSNIHNLCHVTEDVKNFGPLPNISSYPFESALGSLKTLLRSGNQPLAQIAKRLLEICSAENDNTCSISNHQPFLKNEMHNFSPKPPNCKTIFRTLKLFGVEFKVNSKNQWLLTKQNHVVKMLGAYNFDNVIYIYGCSVKNIVDFFNYPFKSSVLNIYLSSGDIGESKSYNITDIKSKLVSLEYDKKHVFIPLLHTLELFT